MNLIEESLKLQHIYDYLYYISMSEEQKQYWRSIRQKYTDEIDKNQNFKSAWSFLAGDRKNDYEKLEKITTEQFNKEKSYPSYFNLLIKNNPQFASEIKTEMAKIANWSNDMAWPIRYTIYKNLDDKIKKNISNLQEDKEQIKKQLDEILTVLEFYEPKMSPTNRRRFYNIKELYPEEFEEKYYSDIHVDALLNFYKVLKLRPIETELSFIKTQKEEKYKKALLSNVRYEDLKIIKNFDENIRRNIIQDVVYLQKLTNQGISFGESGYSNKVLTGLKKDKLMPTEINLVISYADRLEKIIGQKILFN